MKPILFSTPMVQALLNTKPGVWPAKPIDAKKPFKSMTRRVIVLPKKAPEGRIPFYEDIPDPALGVHAYWQVKPKYNVGDILWVRETWAANDHSDCDCEFCQHCPKYGYKADPYNGNDWKWKSPRYMPRKAARIFLEVKSVRVERMQDITPRDCMREGLDGEAMQKDCEDRLHRGECNLTSLSDPSKTEDCYDCENTKTNRFKQLWNTLNAKRGYSFESSPWVWVYEFMRVKK